MKTKEIQFAGAVVYWTLSETDRDKLKKVWDAAGVGAFVPEQRTPYAALKRALTKICKEHRRLVRPLEDEAFAVVKEEVKGAKSKADPLDHSVELVVRINKDESLQFSVSKHKDATRIKETYQHEKSVLPARNVGKALSRILNSLMAAPLRSGIYWLPDHQLPTWEKIARGAESAGLNGSMVVSLRTRMDDELKRGVIKALEDDVQKDIDDIQEIVSDGKAGSRLLNNRATEAQELTKKIAEYEKLMGVTLKKLKKASEDTQALAATAALAAMAGDDE